MNEIESLFELYEKGFKTYGTIMVFSEELRAKISEMTDEEIAMLAARLSRTFYKSLKDSIMEIRDEK